MKKPLHLNHRTGRGDSACLVFLLLLFNLPLAGLSQTLLLRLERDSLMAGDLRLGPEMAEDASPREPWKGLSLYTAFADASALRALAFPVDSPQGMVAALEALATDPIFQAEEGWMPMEAARGPVALANDWSQVRSGLNQAVGLCPTLLVTTSPLGSLSSADFVGLAFSSVQTVPTGMLQTRSITLQSGWDSAVLGQLDTQGLQMVAIPEPAESVPVVAMVAIVLVLCLREFRASRGAAPAVVEA